MSNDTLPVDSGTKKTVFLAVAIFVVLSGMLAYAYLNDNTSHSLIGGADGSTIMYVADGALDKAISKRLLEDYNNSDGECLGEGHVVFGTEEIDGITTVYGLSQQGAFGFQNDNLVKISGSNVIPTVFKLVSSGDGSYSVVEVLYPENGAGYQSSVRELFPKKYESEALEPTAADISALNECELAYAKAYLKKIGRSANTGNYADFPYTILTDVGISSEISNRLIVEYSQFPYWIGTQEIIENGVRYVYETEYDDSTKVIMYKKYIYNSEETAEIIMIDALSGNLVTD